MDREDFLEVLRIFRGTARWTETQESLLDVIERGLKKVQDLEEENTNLASAIIDMNLTLLNIKNELDSFYEVDGKTLEGKLEPWEFPIDAKVETVTPEDTIELRESDEWISY